jgi:hypothetical protein
MRMINSQIHTIDASQSRLEPPKSAAQTPTTTMGGCAEPATRKSALTRQGFFGDALVDDRARAIVPASDNLMCAGEVPGAVVGAVDGGVPFT